MDQDNTKKLTIYMAGGLFDAYKRLGNILLAKALKPLFKEDVTIILPQNEAAKFLGEDGIFDMAKCSLECAMYCTVNDIVLANIDGAQASSGTSLEVGLALYKKLHPDDKKRPIVITYRTDIRTDVKKEAGRSGMYELADDFIYEPAYPKGEEELLQLIERLAQRLHQAIQAQLKIQRP